MTFKNLSSLFYAEAGLATARLADPTGAPEVPAAGAHRKAVVGLNLWVRHSTSDASSAQAQERGVSIKTVVMRALEQAGVAIACVDLKDRDPIPPKRSITT